MSSIQSLNGDLSQSRPTFITVELTKRKQGKAKEKLTKDKVGVWLSAIVKDTEEAKPYGVMSANFGDASDERNWIDTCDMTATDTLDYVYLLAAIRAIEIQDENKSLAIFSGCRELQSVVNEPENNDLYERYQDDCKKLVQLVNERPGKITIRTVSSRSPECRLAQEQAAKFSKKTNSHRVTLNNPLKTKVAKEQSEIETLDIKKKTDGAESKEETSKDSKKSNAAESKEEITKEGKKSDDENTNEQDDKDDDKENVQSDDNDSAMDTTDMPAKELDQELAKPENAWGLNLRGFFDVLRAPFRRTPSSSD
ncbi:hypothetical protein DM01DRAFT_1410198 [Hesseltinella vesiculosa]|uniref:Uncharacterized protein n=1 Tax=Hesseltinella vesiculosa TaxID=101127 RepID=A0A1X2G811_9FUNG|nr:hypothetical protein DM01DRAFT_1410198 [Hesseltinella vesiculosa]